MGMNERSSFPVKVIREYFKLCQIFFFFLFELRRAITNYARQLTRSS